ncbi:hypothetical protein ACWATR_33195 [Nostoc sp. UIC 10890]
MLVNSIEKRVQELNENLELSLDEVFYTVCQEYNLNAVAIEEALGCKCPFALIGFITTLKSADSGIYTQYKY